MVEHHAIFSRFKSAPPADDPGVTCDFIGARFRREYGDSAGDLSAGVTLPPFGQSYFEWLDILHSVEQAEGSYTFIELGAGYGVWSIRALLAAKQRRLVPARAIAVEADPLHADWCRRAAAENGLSDGDLSVIEAAVTDKTGERRFYVEHPDAAMTPSTWYGQALDHPSHAAGSATARRYEGHEVQTVGDWGAIVVKTVAFNEIMARAAIVDIVHMDIQGEELRVVESSLDVLNEKVKCLHIGTHGPDIEGGLIRALSAAGWRNRRIHLCGQRQETPYGVIDFADGQQTWFNPAFYGHDGGW